MDLAVLDEREALRTVETLAAVKVRDTLRGDRTEADDVLPGSAVANSEALFAKADEATRAIAARRALQVRRTKLRALMEAQRVAAIATENPQAYDYDLAAEQSRSRSDARPSRRSATRVAPRHQRSVVTRHAVAKRGSDRVVRFGGGMTAVVAFARSQVGKRYVTGGTGQGGFDCSGLTKQAYALAGIRLPHSSGAQAARSRSVSRANARAGDLVVGPGHVGIYMGRGMMIDAGNHRTGVVYRKVYSGLRVARIGG